MEQSSPGLEPLLLAAAMGDQDAWRAVVGMYARRVFALAKSRLRRVDLAEEVTQSVFCTVAAKLGRSEGGSEGGGGGYTEQGRFESWLFRVAVNRIRDEVRRLKRHATPTDPDAFAEIAVGGVGVGGVGLAGGPSGPGGSGTGEGLDAGGAGTELFALRAAMDSLSAQDREIVELRHHAGLSFNQIGAVLEEPLGTLLARHHRALRKLKEMITARIGAPEDQA